MTKRPFLYAQYYNNKGKHIEQKEIHIRRDNSNEQNSEIKSKGIGFKIEDKSA